MARRLRQCARLNLKQVNDLLLEAYSTRLHRRVLTIATQVTHASTPREVENVILLLLREIDEAFRELDLTGEFHLEHVPQLTHLSLSGLQALEGRRMYREYMRLLRHLLATFLS